MIFRTLKNNIETQIIKIILQKQILKTKYKLISRYFSQTTNFSSFRPAKEHPNKILIYGVHPRQALTKARYKIKAERVIKQNQI